jgi:hypothetical protein
MASPPFIYDPPADGLSVHLPFADYYSEAPPDQRPPFLRPDYQSDGPFIMPAHQQGAYLDSEHAIGGWLVSPVPEPSSPQPGFGIDDSVVTLPSTTGFPSPYPMAPPVSAGMSYQNCVPSTFDTPMQGLGTAQPLQAAPYPGVEPSWSQGNTLHDHLLIYRQ